MKVLCEEQRDLPLVDVKVVVQPGPVADPVGHEGLSRHAAELMRRGAGSRARAELDLALDAIGAAVDVEASQDSVVFSGHCLSRHLPRLLELMGDIVCRPTFPADEHGKLVRESLALLDEIRDDDASLAGRCPVNVTLVMVKM